MFPRSWPWENICLKSGKHKKIHKNLIHHHEGIQDILGQGRRGIQTGFLYVALAILELTHSVDQTGLEQRDLSPSVSWVLGSKVCTTWTPGSYHFYLRLFLFFSFFFFFFSAMVTEHKTSHMRGQLYHPALPQHHPPFGRYFKTGFLYVALAVLEFTL